jgi:putative acetyltransferase
LLPQKTPTVRITEARPEDMPRVRELFIEYQKWLDIDLCFQDFEQELKTLPGKYAPPRGLILLAFVGDSLIGCVGIRPRTEDEAELKRLYVQPPFQGCGIGR